MNPRITITVGPSCFSEEMWDAYISEGVHAFRVPFSKETPDEQFTRCQLLSEKLRSKSLPPLVIADFPGMSPRFTNSERIEIAAGSLWEVSDQYDQIESGLKTTYFDLLSTLPTGSEIIIGDGELSAIVLGCTRRLLTIQFHQNGVLKKQRSIYSTHFDNSLGPIGDFERRVLADQRVEFIDAFMISFCSSANQVIEFSKATASYYRRGAPKIIAKIETTCGVIGTRDLLNHDCDLLLARGDLLVTSGPSNFFRNEFSIIETCQRGDQIDRLMVGTGLLESFATSGEHARSELSYLGWLKSLGVSSFLLSAETTIGHNGLRCVRQIKQMFGD